MADEKKTSARSSGRTERDAPPAPMTQAELDEHMEELEGTSQQAQFSTYAEVEPPDENPPAGRMVEQTLGRPTEGAQTTRFGE